MRKHKSLKGGLINGAPCDMLLDTGTTQSMVRSVLTTDDYIDGQTTICCAHGVAKSYPMAPVQVEIDGTKQIIMAASSETLPQADRDKYHLLSSLVMTCSLLLSQMSNPRLSLLVSEIHCKESDMKKDTICMIT